MIDEIVERMKKIIETEGREKLIKDYKPGEGIYIKVSREEIKEEDLFWMTRKVDTTLDIYNWFRERDFFEGILNNTSNKALLQSGVLKKRIHSVTPYALTIKYESINLALDNLDELKRHFKIVSSISSQDVLVDEISEFFHKKLLEFKTILDLKKIKLNNKDRISMFLEKPIKSYEESFMDYVKDTGFMKSYPLINVDGEIYGVPCLGMSLDSKKPTITNKNIRDVPFRVSFFDNLMLVYIGKMGSSINNLINENEDIKYSLSLKRNDIVNIEKNKEAHKKYKFNSWKVISENSTLSISSQKSRKEVLWLIENYLTNNIIMPAINKFIYGGKKTSDYVNSSFSNIEDYNILQKIVSNKDALDCYFNKNYNLDIEDLLENILKSTYEYYCNLKDKVGDKVQLKNKNYFTLCEFKLDMIISVMDYVSEKEIYKEMVIKLDEILKKFLEQKKNKEINITNAAEFYFMSGQLIRYLASKSETSIDNKKANLMGNFMLKSKDDIKDHIIKMYDRYAHVLPLYATSYVNLVFQQIIAYGIGELEEKNKDNWYYYQAGLTGKNIIFYSEIDD